MRDALISALIALSAGSRPLPGGPEQNLVGLLVGKFWDRTDETKRWVRDNQARAHADYVTAFQELRQVLRWIATLERDSEPWLAARVRRREIWSSYNASLVQVELYGSIDVYRRALEVDQLLRQLSVATSSEPMTLDLWHEKRQPMDSAMRSCVDAVRADLKLPPQGDRSAWVSTNLVPFEPE